MTINTSRVYVHTIHDDTRKFPLLSEICLNMIFSLPGGHGFGFVLPSGQ